MPASLMAAMTSAWTWALWFLSSGMKLLKSAWDTSHQWFAVGCAAFILLVYFGYVSKPRVDTDSAAAVASISAKLDALKKDMATKEDIGTLEADISAVAPKKPMTTGSIVRKSKPRDE